VHRIDGLDARESRAHNLTTRNLAFEDCAGKGVCREVGDVHAFALAGEDALG